MASIEILLKKNYQFFRKIRRLNKREGLYDICMKELQQLYDQRKFNN